MFSPEPKLYPNFISEEERIVLKNHALYLLDTKVLQPNNYGPHRFSKLFFSLEQIPEFHRMVYHRVVSVLGLENPIIDPYLGMVISVIEPKGFVHPHIDKYSEHAQYLPRLQPFLGHKNFRFNIMVDRDEDISYSPHISNQPFVVNIRDAWCFVASELEHSTPPLKGKKNRVVYQFGFAVDQLHQDTSDYDKLIYGYNK